MTGTGIAFSDIISFSENFNRCRTPLNFDRWTPLLNPKGAQGRFVCIQDGNSMQSTYDQQQKVPSTDAKTNHKANVSGIITERNFNLQSRFGN